MKKTRKKKNVIKATFSAPKMGKEIDPFNSTLDITNAYGTYNIQPTADSDNEFPAISQGYSDKKKPKDKTQ